MSNRFFIEGAAIGQRVALTGDEARHLAKVMRARPGDVVVLFNGQGVEFTAEVADVSRDAVQLQVLASRDVDRESPVSVTLGVALPRGDRQRWLIEKATELGVHRVVPLVTTRGVAQPVDRAIERLRRNVIEASKQCGRNRLMEITAAASVEDYFASPPEDAVRLLAHPGETSVPLHALHQPTGSGTIYVAIGPEGGFTDQEVAAATRWELISLGPRILRVETAALAVAAKLVLAR